MRNVRIAIEVEPDDPRDEPFYTGVTVSVDNSLTPQEAAVQATANATHEVAKAVDMEFDNVVKLMLTDIMDKFRGFGRGR